VVAAHAGRKSTIVRTPSDATAKRDAAVREPAAEAPAEAEDTAVENHRQQLHQCPTTTDVHLAVVAGEAAAE
jgi:hypothetical protein